MIGIILLSFLMPSTVYSFSCDFCGQSWECDDTWTKCGTNGLESPGCSSQGRCSDSCCAGSGGGCNKDDWGGWSSCSASCGGGTQSRNNACGTNQIQSCNTQACYVVPTVTLIPAPTLTPIPTPTPTPDFRFPFQFMGIKLGTLPPAQNRKIFAQGYLDPGCYHESKEPTDVSIRQRAAQTCAFFYDPQTPSNPLAGFTDFYTYYGKFLKDSSVKVYTVIKQSIFSF